jgi:hypothetical protein
MQGSDLRFPVLAEAVVICASDMCLSRGGSCFTYFVSLAAGTRGGLSRRFDNLTVRLVRKTCRGEHESEG